MKRNKVIVLLLIAFVMCTYTICMRYLKFEYLNKGLPEVKLKNKTDKNNTMAIMISNDGNNYEEYKKETWPSYGYKFKEAKCINNNGEEVKRDVIYNDGKIILTTNQTLYCTLYFDYKGTIEILRENDSNNTISSNLQGGMYRYQGTGDIPNWICFGTSDADTCKTEEGIDKYMYRIIGITEDGKMKLIKETLLKEKNGGVRFSWDTYGDINPSSVNYCNNPDNCAEWNTSLLFKRINGISNGNTAGTGSYSNKANTDIFIDSEVYDYLKSGDSNGGNSASIWYNLISEHDWMYGDMSENVASILYNGDTMYKIETGELETKHYIGPMENITEEQYKWPKTNKVTAKIGLIYMHDMDYAYPEGNPSNETNLKNSWLHFRKDGYNESSTYEWLITRYGLGGPNKTNIDSWAVWYTSGFAGWDSGGSLTSAGGARPVFYLDSITKLAGGEGTKENPFIINIE